MYQANCFNVMIVSPSDISEEREIAKNVLYRWNELNSRFHNIVFSVLGYDINAHADSGVHPQESLNHQLLEQADLIIAIFWTKLGTPTTEYSSGSVEEITKHIQQGKRALIYFSNKQVSPDKFNSDQYQKLQDYKKSIQGSAFYKDFSSEDEFKSLLNDEIQLIANELTQGNSSFQPINHDISEIEKNILLSIQKNGYLYYVRLINGINLNGELINDLKTIAFIKEAVDSLEEKGLIVSRSSKREIFDMSAKGFRAIDQLIQN
ncbi:MAG: hypothetical protein IJ207_02810 [Treponema sp.]|uniref:hypothetical protein n=1 Tax=Treponema sp. TaxID=166 RepID=UPI0025D2AAC5|nr:hypothetical protein [Treponema sp.]MBQ9281111.1 hypothetical protein [Treponema sp.]